MVKGWHMGRIWVGSFLLCVLTAYAAPPSVPGPGASLPPAFKMVDGSGQTYYSTWTQGDNSTPRAYLTKEPDYRSAPVYFSLDIGNARDRFITLALDESDGPGKGYDTLYVDANCHGDLTDYPPIKMQAQSQSAQYTQWTAKEPVALTVRYHDGTSRQIATRIEVSANRYGANQTNWRVTCRSSQHAEGKIALGDKELLVGIYDITGGQGMANWCFDDYGTDRLRIDTKGTGKLDKAEDMPLSRIIALDGKLWEIDVDSAATKMVARQCNLPSGPLAVVASFDKNAKVTGGSIELANHAGIAFSTPFNAGAAFTAPAGKYRISKASLTLTDAAGKKWDAAFSSPRAVEVVGQTGASLTVGMPLKVEPVIANTGPSAYTDGVSVFRLGGQFQVSHEVVGPQGERYSSLAQQGVRNAPGVRILDSEGIEVASGSMEYG